MDIDSLLGLPDIDSFAVENVRSIEFDIAGMTSTSTTEETNMLYGADCASQYVIGSTDSSKYAAHGSFKFSCHWSIG